MVYEVFRTRYEGNKLPSPEAVKHTRRVGELLYYMRVYDPRPGRGIWLATLTARDGETYLIPALDRAYVREIRGGTLISGREVIPRGIGMKNIKSDSYPQTWWCRPLPPPASGFADVDLGTPGESQCQTRRELESTLEARKIAETISHRPRRRMTCDPRTASGLSPGHF